MKLQSLNKATSAFQIAAEDDRSIPGAIRPEVKRVLQRQCNISGVLLDIASFAKDNFFEDKKYKPLRMWQVKRVVSCAFFLVVVTKKLLDCFE